MILKFGLILVALSILAGEMARQFRVRRDQKLRLDDSAMGLTGEEMARRVLDLGEVRNVDIVAQDGLLTDEYDPVNRTLRLAPQNFHGRNFAALGTAMHVAGHALQADAGHRPLQWRRSAIVLTTFGTPLAFLVALPLLIIQFRFGLLVLGLMWAFIRLNNIVTLPVEIDASARAKDLLRQAKVLRLGKDMDRLETMLRAAELDKFSGFLRFWSYIFSFIFPWRKR